jgi:hypothetical protein
MWALPLIDRPWQLPAASVRTLGALLALALLSTVVAQMLYSRLLATAGVTNPVQKPGGGTHFLIVSENHGVREYGTLHN